MYIYIGLLMVGGGGLVSVCVRRSASLLSCVAADLESCEGLLKQTHRLKGYFVTITHFHIFNIYFVSCEELKLYGIQRKII